MRGNFFIFVLSRVVVGLARQKKEQKRGKRFFVLIIPYWTFMYKPSIGAIEDVRAGGRGGEVLGFLVLLMASSRASHAPTGFVLFT
jgi:hypothetical protein